MSARAERVTFAGHAGHRLAGILERPDGEVWAHALFAHCFTCSKDSLAAARISRALAALGVAVLRLDFTGVGDSEGEFGASGFSSDLDDLVAAADFVAAEHGPVEMLVGHSLGGAAVLAAAARVETARAVVTLGAPSDPAHVEHLLAAATPEIESRGEALVDIGGRPFCIKRSFLDDLRSHQLLEEVGELRRALLVMHSPVDTVVGIDHAAAIFGAARHPKSFVTLDDADHLLTRPRDAGYAAEIIAAWSSRYLSAPEASASAAAAPPEVAASPLPEGEVRVAESGAGRYVQDVQAGRHRLRADEPRAMGGDDLGPGPYEYLVAALGACTSMTLRMYADRKEWPLQRVEVRLRHRKIHARDCADCSSDSARVDEIERWIGIEGDLEPEQRSRLMEIADRCPVHRTLHGEVKVRTRVLE